MMVMGSISFMPIHSTKRRPPEGRDWVQEADYGVEGPVDNAAPAHDNPHNDTRDGTAAKTDQDTNQAARKVLPQNPVGCKVVKFLYHR